MIISENSSTGRQILAEIHRDSRSSWDKFVERTFFIAVLAVTVAGLFIGLCIKG